MTFLLDTHTLIWAMSSRKLLSVAVQLIIDDPDNKILISAASAWEIATRVRLGKLPEAEPPEQDFLNLVDRAGYTLLPISVSDALLADAFSARTATPFDRILAAQAHALDIPILSLDPKLDAFGIRRIW